MSMKLDTVSKSYGAVEVLKGVSLEIEKGDFLVLLGGSGCGKSTLLNCIAGLEGVTSGKIEIVGRDVTEIEPAKRNVAMVFQSYALYPTMTVERNISFGLECARVSKSERKEAVNRVAALLQIEELLDRKPSQLSGGQRQRVAIGRALVRNPDLFLLDEPMSNLDAKLRNQMRFELRELHQKLQATFVLVTHDQVEAMSMATKVAVLDMGIVQQFGTPYDIYYFPRNMFVAAFVGSTRMNFVKSEIKHVDGVAHISFAENLCSLGSYAFEDGVPAEGHKVVLGIRPENIYRSKERLEGHDFIEGDFTVARSELTGGDVQVWFEQGDQELVSRFRSTRTPELGSVSHLYLDMKNVSIFDRETELRL